MTTQKKPRICSLLPSATEIVFALGLEEHLVAVTHECDYPSNALRMPRVTRSEITSSLASVDIHTRVREQLSDTGTLYSLDTELLDRLAPDLIFTQQLCTVCAVSYDNVYRAAQKLRSRPSVINLEPNSLAGIFASILQVGELTGTAARAKEYVSTLQDRVEHVRKTVEGSTQRKILCLEWVDPPFCAGHWIPELVEIAGGEDGLGRKHLPSQQVAPQQIFEYNPDILVLMCCGFSVQRTVEEISLLSKSGLEKLSAVRNGEVYVVDGSSYFSRPGPRIVDSIEILATILHPDLFSDDLFPTGFPEEVARKIHNHEPVHSYNRR